MADNRRGAGKKVKGSGTYLDSASTAASRLAKRTTDGAQAAWNSENSKSVRRQASKTASSWLEATTKASKGIAGGFFAGLSEAKPPEAPSMLQRMRGEPAGEEGWRSAGRQAGKAVRESAVAAAESAREAATAGTISYLRTIRNWTVGIFILGCFAYGVGSAMPNALRGVVKDRFQRKGNSEEEGPTLGDWARGAWSSMLASARQLKDGVAGSDTVEGAKAAAGERVSRWKESLPGSGKEAWSKLRSKLGGTQQEADKGDGGHWGWFGGGRKSEDK